MLALAYAQKIRSFEPAIGESFLTFAEKVASLKLDKCQAIIDKKKDQVRQRRLQPNHAQGGRCNVGGHDGEGAGDHVKD